MPFIFIFIFIFLTNGRTIALKKRTQYKTTSKPQAAGH